MIILKTSIECRKFLKDRSNLPTKKQDDDALKDFLSKAFEKEKNIIKTKIEFNQLDYFKSFLNSNEYLDKFIEFLIAEYEKYSIQNKSNDEIEKIAYEYFLSLNGINPPLSFNLKRVFTLNTFYPMNTHDKNILLSRKSLINKIKEQ